MPESKTQFVAEIMCAEEALVFLWMLTVLLDAIREFKAGGFHAVNHQTPVTSLIGVCPEI